MQIFSPFKAASKLEDVPKDGTEVLCWSDKKQISNIFRVPNSALLLLTKSISHKEEAKTTYRDRKSFLGYTVFYCTL